MKVGGSMVEIIKTVLLRWLGHMKGMKDNRSQKSMYEWIPTGRRKKGSSKLRVTRKQSKAWIVRERDRSLGGQREIKGNDKFLKLLQKDIKSNY